LLDAIGGEAEQVVKSYDRKAEARKIAENAMSAVTASAAVEVGAVGLGTLVTILATTAAAEWSPDILASGSCCRAWFLYHSCKTAQGEK